MFLVRHNRYHTAAVEDSDPDIAFVGDSRYHTDRYTAAAAHSRYRIGRYTVPDRHNRYRIDRHMVPDPDSRYHTVRQEHSRFDTADHSRYQKMGGYCRSYGDRNLQEARAF